jgi:hypothetical protein
VRLSLESGLFVGADVVRILYGRQHRAAVNGLASSIPPGSEEQGMCTPGFPRNVGDPVVSSLKDPAGATGRLSPRPMTRVLGVVWSEDRHKAGTAKRRQRSAAGGAAGSRSIE